MEKTEIVCILDRSGSMESIIDDAIGGFNNFIKEQKELDGEATITIAIFDNEYKLLTNNLDLQKLKPLTKKDWQPRGTTALYDAIGKTINTIKENQKKLKKKDRPKVIVVIVTDGMENDSKEYDRDSIFKLINKQKEKKWGFVYLAANQDAFAVGSQFGMSMGSTLNYIANSAGVKHYSQKMSQSVASFRMTSKKDLDVDNLIKDDED